MPCDIGGDYPAFRQHALRDDRDRKDGRLGVLGEPKMLVGAFKAKPRERKPERLVGLVKGLASDGEVVVEVAAHPDRLRSLAWKEKGYLLVVHVSGYWNGESLR